MTTNNNIEMEFNEQAEEQKKLIDEFKKLEVEKKSMEKEISDLWESLNQSGMPGVNQALTDSEGFPIAGIDLYAIRRSRHRLACLKNDHKEIMIKIESTLHKIHNAVPKRKTNECMAMSANNDKNKGSSTDKDGDDTQTVSKELIENEDKNNIGRSKMTQQIKMNIDNSLSTDSSSSSDKYTNKKNLNNELTEADSPSYDRELLRAFAIVDEVISDSPAELAGLEVSDLIIRFDDLIELSTSSTGELKEIQNCFEQIPMHVREGIPVTVEILRNGRLKSLTLTPSKWNGRGLLGCVIKPLDRI